MSHSCVDTGDEVETSDQRSSFSERGKPRGNIAQHPALLKVREARTIIVAYIRLQREEIRVGIQHRLQLFERDRPIAIIQMRTASRPHDSNARSSNGACKQIVPLRDKRVVCVQIWTRRREIGCTNLQCKRKTQGWNVLVETWHLSCLTDNFGHTPIIFEERQQCILNTQHDMSTRCTEPIHEAHKLQRVAEPLLRAVT